MSLEHLQGKRTGRPRGAKSASPWRRDAIWAYRNLGRPDAQPPTALAGLLAALGREHPDRLAACLFLMEAPGDQAEPRKGETSEPQPNGSDSAGNPPRRVRNLFVDTPYLVRRLTGDGTAIISNFPEDPDVVACAVDPSRGGIVLTLHSPMFPIVAEGESVFEMTAEYGWDMRSGYR